MNDLEERELPLRGEGCLRPVENIDALLEPIGEQSQERLAVGLLVKGLPTVGPQVLCSFGGAPT